MCYIGGLRRRGVKMSEKFEPEIHDRGRGPEIKGTRITVYDVMDYYKHGWSHATIAAIFRLSSAEIIAAIEYIEAHKSEVEADYQKILERHARGNSPEVEAKWEQTKMKVDQLVRAAAERRRRPNASVNG
jgi:uncharacterized protein (DUF433 family)